MLLDSVGGDVFCYNGSVIIEDRGPVRQFSQGFAYLQVPDDKSSAWNRVVAEGYASSIGSTPVDGGSWIIGADRRIGYSDDKPFPWARWRGFMGKQPDSTVGFPDIQIVCYWWHFRPQLFYYTETVTDLNQLPLDCAAVDLRAVSIEDDGSGASGRI